MCVCLFAQRQSGAWNRPGNHGASAEVRLTRAFGSGKVRRRRCGRERGVEVTVWEQQGRRMKHEGREGEMEMCHIYTANTFFTAT